jgi:hypothetical protein
MSKLSTSAVPAAPQASRRALLMGFAVAATPMAPGLATALSEPAHGDVDPIFDVIRRHWDAQETLDAACRANDLDMEEDPLKQAAYDRAIAAELPLFTTTPTTIAGVAALLEYVGSDVHPSLQDEDDTGRSLTVLSYASDWSADALIDAVHRFPVHVAAALRNIIARGLA